MAGTDGFPSAGSGECELTMTDCKGAKGQTKKVGSPLDFEGDFLSLFLLAVLVALVVISKTLVGRNDCMCGILRAEQIGYYEYQHVGCARSPYSVGIC